ncbi:unnamed protein product [Polarella glacialis]|uniref:Histone-lysine N-methyltransferase, H3 lysine-79 specific n=1 Tax=Polarella glacialis TaxID=89957 RepID=A0A813FDS6_POLGL|nr:unnamed protein product [Polarella glacialis]CAE8624720.1 unnamed protein product [Polarella glacialis]
MTHFVLNDVVQCAHGPAGRCLQCSGRLVQNVPLQLYSGWCSVYSSPASSSTSPAPRPPGGAAAARELPFPALAALIACLAPEPGERLLHLGSGAGRALAAWALLVPRGAACGVESCPLLHGAALAAVNRLDPEVQQRVFAHNGDLFDMQGDWHQASAILVNTDGLDDNRLRRVAEGLVAAGPGARVVSISRPLCPDARSAPLGFELARQAAYRTVGLGNTNVFIYRKVGAG